MCDEILETITKDVDFYNEIKEEFTNIKQMNIVNRAALTEKLYINVKKFEKAFEIAGDTIYDLSIENEELTDQLKQFGTYDKTVVDKAIKLRKLNTSNDNKNKIILKQLKKSVDKAKQITQS